MNQEDNEGITAPMPVAAPGAALAAVLATRAAPAPTTMLLITAAMLAAVRRPFRSLTLTPKNSLEGLDAFGRVASAKKVQALGHEAPIVGADILRLEAVMEVFDAAHDEPPVRELAEKDQRRNDRRGKRQKHGPIVGHESHGD